MAKRKETGSRPRRQSRGRRRESIREFAEMSRTRDALRERVKELQCLYAVSSLSERHFATPAAYLQAVVEQLPRAWHYPTFASARITHDGAEYRCGACRGRPWQMAHDITMNGNVVGAVEVLYRDGVPAPDGEPFLREEYALLRAVAERIGRDLSHMQMVSDLREAHDLLQNQYRVGEETNITLRNVLRRVEEEKREASAAIVENIRRIVMPVVAELEVAATGRQKAYVSLLRQSLQDICSPFLTQLVRDHLELTPAEVAITAMLRNGLSTKEIAQIRCITPATVRRHRENIRRALGLQNRKINLVTYLRSSAGQASPSAAAPALEEPGSPAPRIRLVG